MSKDTTTFEIGTVWVQRGHNTSTCAITLCVIEPRTHPKFRILQKNFTQRRNSNSNLLINSKRNRNRSNLFSAGWYVIIIVPGCPNDRRLLRIQHLFQVFSQKSSSMMSRHPYVSHWCGVFALRLSEDPRRQLSLNVKKGSTPNRSQPI